MVFGSLVFVSKDSVYCCFLCDKRQCLCEILVEFSPKIVPFHSVIEMDGNTREEEILKRREFILKN